MRVLTTVGALLVVACTGSPPDDPSPRDAGPRDVGEAPTRDAGRDASVAPHDAGVRDGGVRDGGGVATTDAGPDGGNGDPPGTWRSALFPAAWAPLHAGGTTDPEGRALPDFSSAGWHRGEQRPPAGHGPATRVVDGAFGDGILDATLALQAAIDRTCEEGGGVVVVPEGTYRLVLPNAAAPAALEIRCSRLVLRGEGPSRTRFLFDDALRARGKAVILVKGEGRIRDGDDPRAFLTADATPASRTIDVADAASFVVGQTVAVRNFNTPRFREEHRMDPGASGLAGLWPEASFWGLAYPRRIEAIVGTRVTLDAPVHYTLRAEDNARLQSLVGFIEEVGLESFAVGMVENRTTPGRLEPASDDDYQVAGTTGYEVHASRVIEMDAVHDAWVHDVDTYRPATNTGSAHILSNGILLEEGAFRVTIADCDLSSPQYRGGGGNGYLFHLQGHDALIVDGTATGARHGITVNHAGSGNVVLRLTTRGGRYADDAHRFLANANLFDGSTLDGAWLQAVNRGTTSSGAGFTATRHVYWRTHVARNHSSAQGCALESAQWGFGYLIGSSSAAGATARLCATSFSNRTWSSLDLGDPQDWVEGEEMGQTLWPPSLFGAQLAARCAREGRTCVTW